MSHYNLSARAPDCTSLAICMMSACMCHVHEVAIAIVLVQEAVIASYMYSYGYVNILKVY